MAIRIGIREQDQSGLVASSDTVTLGIRNINVKKRVEIGFLSRRKDLSSVGANLNVNGGNGSARGFPRQVEVKPRQFCALDISDIVYHAFEKLSDTPKSDTLD